MPGPLLVLVLAWWLRRSALLGLLLLLLTPGASLAQVDAQRVDLVDGGDFPVLWEGDLGVPWSVAASLSLNAAGNLAILEGVPEADVLIDQVWTWQPHLSANLGGVARVGATLPHHAVTFLGRRVDGLQRGDLGLWLSIPLTKEEAEAKAAWMVRVDVPTGPEELLLGDVGVVTGLYSTTFPAGPFEGTLNLGAAVQQAVALPGAVWGSHWVYGVGLRMEPAGPTWVTAELVGNAPVRFWGGAPAQYPLEAVLSGGAVASRTLSAGLGLGVGLTQGLGSSSFRLTGLVDVRPRQERDRDGDGIADLRDLCRREPEDRDGHRDRDGCPDLDNDRDGLPDLADVCPDLAEVFNQHEDSDGCPDRITRLEVAVLAVAGLEQATVTVGAGRPTTVFPGEVLTRRVDLDLVEIEVTAPDFLPHRAELTLAEGTIRHEVALAPVRYGQVEVRATSAGSEGSRPDGAAPTLRRPSTD